VHVIGVSWSAATQAGSATSSGVQRSTLPSVLVHVIGAWVNAVGAGNNYRWCGAACHLLSLSNVYYSDVLADSQRYAVLWC
jgi:hypothetical protein